MASFPTNTKLLLSLSQKCAKSNRVLFRQFKSLITTSQNTLHTSNSLLIRETYRRCHEPLFQLQSTFLISTKSDDCHPHNNSQPANERSSSQQSQNINHLLNKIGFSESQWRIKEPKYGSEINGTTKSATSSRRANGKKRQQKFSSHCSIDQLSEGNRKLSNREDQRSDIMSHLKVRSIHVAQTIDVVNVLTKVFGELNPSSRHSFGRNSVIVELPSREQLNGYDESLSSTSYCEYEPRYAAIFRYGSVVFFNVTAKDTGRWVDQIKKHAGDPISRGFERKEYFEVAICPGMEEMAEVNADFVTVKQLNMSNVNVIATIMAQTVALDSYNDVVDELLSTFASINSTVKRAGNFTEMERETLFKVVAQNNSVFIDMIANLGIKDRNYTAWNKSHLEQINEGLKNEFEIDNRFDQIEFKLNLIQQNAQFFVQVLQSQKADFAEWIIIVLIAFECILMILEMSGVGETLFSQLSIGEQSDSKPS